MAEHRIVCMCECVRIQDSVCVDEYRIVVWQYRIVCVWQNTG